MRKHFGIFLVCIGLAVTGVQAQNCTLCSGINCAFDGITGDCKVNCTSNYTYSVGGTITTTPLITGGVLQSWSGNSFIVKWNCPPTGVAGTGTMEVHYTNNGNNYITEGQTCICPPKGGNPPPSDYCENVNLNCASDGITGPCNVIQGSTANYSVSTSGTITWIVDINGSITNYYGASVSITWPGPGPYVANIEVLRNGAHFTEGMVCVDVN